MQARWISYLRCAAYLRPLPRTHQQQKQLLAQTHSRGRAMLAPITKIRLPPRLGVFPSLFHLHDGAVCHLCSLNGKQGCKSDIRNSLSLLAHERTRSGGMLILRSNIHKFLFVTPLPVFPDMLHLSVDFLLPDLIKIRIPRLPSERMCFSKCNN